ncbi:nuclear transport factor 2 family protein [Marivirga tractuosa]|uniref:YybH family protein n=1 Tax=Marivirga tractuosa TaxID=1006 RepID=UPI0035D0A266
MEKPSNLKCLLLIGLLNLSVTVSNAAAQENPQAIDSPKELERVLRDYETHWQNSNATQLANLFTEDAYILRPNKPITKGRSNIEEAYQNAGGRLVLEAYDYSIDGTTGYIIGGYKGHESLPAMGKFILTLRKEEGKWMITADMDNRNEPGKNE